MTPIIQVQDLHKAYGDFKAVQNLSFTVQRGEVYGFLGQNGAGKSTTIRMLLSLIRPNSGRIEIMGKELHTHRSEILRSVGAIIERPDLYKYLTAYENLSLFARLSGFAASKNQLMQQLEWVGLQERAYSKVSTFSQGMKQRLGLAIALIHNPELVILDEPTNGLDPQGIADVRKMILQLSREQGKTVLISSHLLSEIELIADRMIIIDRGKKVVEGAVKELMDPAKMKVMIMLENASIIQPILKQSNWGQYMMSFDEHQFQLELHKDHIPELTKDLVGMGAAILSIQPRHSLEDYFLSLTKTA
jgi:ABC-2 type transport system ATP-binding protein